MGHWQLALIACAYITRALLNAPLSAVYNRLSPAGSSVPLRSASLESGAAILAARVWGGVAFGRKMPTAEVLWVMSDFLIAVGSRMPLFIHRPQSTLLGSDQDLLSDGETGAVQLPQFSGVVGSRAQVSWLSPQGPDH